MIRLNEVLVFQCLEELSSKEAQETLWLSNGDGDVSSFSEVVEQLFTDSGLDDALSTKDVVFEKNVDTKLRELSYLLATIDSGMPPQDIISCFAMRKVRLLSREVLDFIKGFRK